MITVALPTYNNSPIIWLQLESLCRQVNAPEWELIVAEEISGNYFGKKGLSAYADRLKAAGCVNVKYLNVSRRLPLARKWMLIADHMDADSSGFVLCASDDYSASNRLQLTYEALSNGAEWLHWKSGYFYNILTGESSLYYLDSIVGLCMAASRLAIENARRRAVGSDYPYKGVDTWLRRLIGDVPTHVFDEITLGVHTDGYNTISLGRRLLYGSNHFKIANTDDVVKLFPTDIYSKLLTYKS